MHLALSFLLALLCLQVGSAHAVADDAAGNRAADDSDRVFGPTRVWKIHLRISAENWQAMQPTRGGMPGFGPPPVGGPTGPSNGGTRPGGEQPPTNPPRNAPAQPGDQPPRGAGPGELNRGGPPGPGPAFRPGSFGYEFDYVKADVELNDETFAEVGLRFKGNGTYMMSASGRKRPFKIDFNRYSADQRFHGMQQLNLHNNVMDPTHVRQALSYPVFQAAGVPSPRTAFADVTLTIDGVCERERLGLYTLVEEIDKAFLRRHFPSSKGLLLKPEGTQGFEYKGEDWTAYAWYEPKSKPKKSEARRLIETLRLIHTADDDQFRREIGSYLETDEFARFLAANTLLANMDSFLTHVHNYYLYLPPESNKIVVLPWDMDLSMGAFFMAGSTEQLQELSIAHPHMGDNKLLDRLLAWDEFNRVYRDHLRRLTESCFGDDGSTTHSLPIVRAAIKDLVAEDAKLSTARGPGGFGPGPGAGLFGSGSSLETFLVKRRESVLAQLAGTSQGRRPAMGFGPGVGGPRGGPGGFGPGNFLSGPFLRAADTNQDQKISRQEFVDLGANWLRDWDKDKNGSLDGEEISAGLNTSLGPPPNAGPGPGGFKPPAGVGPGMFLGTPLFKLADADSDGKTSNEEWTLLFDTWFKGWETTSDGSLDAAEVAAGLNKAFPPPPGFGPPAPPKATNTPQNAVPQ